MVHSASGFDGGRDLHPAIANERPMAEVKTTSREAVEWVRIWL
jgi:hypothetical protein